MFKACLTLLVIGLWPAIAQAGTLAPCDIQRVASAGANIWLLCDREEIYVSSDEGTSWQARRVPTDAKLRAIALLDAQRGFVAGDDGTLLATEDGGKTWRQVPLEVKENLTAIQFVGNEGWLAGWTGVMLHSVDGGKTWTRQQTGVLQGLKSIFFLDRDKGWAAGWAGTILRTNDGGKTWEQARMEKTQWTLECIRFRDAQNGWAVGFNGQILRSRDGGASWAELECPLQAWLKSVAFDSNGRGWIAADNQALVSEDGGETWKVKDVPGSPFLNQVLAVNKSLWMVGQFGILRSTGPRQELAALATLPEPKGAGGKS